MRLLRRAQLLLTLSLLTSAAAAHAECAWVLWRHTAAGPEGLSQIVTEDWDPMGAVESKSECDRMVVRLAPSGSIREYKTLQSGVRGQMLAILHCFPDTVDPRGPKGK